MSSQSSNQPSEWCRIQMRYSIIIRTNSTIKPLLFPFILSYTRQIICYIISVLIWCATFAKLPVLIRKSELRICRWYIYIYICIYIYKDIWALLCAFCPFNLKPTLHMDSASSILSYRRLSSKRANSPNSNLAPCILRCFMISGPFY